MFNKLLLLGCGGVQQNVLAILDDFYPELDYQNVFILDQHNKRKEPAVAMALQKGATFIQETITRTNYASVLGSIVQDGDQVIDLTVGIDCQELVRWCLDNGVNYINTALELWDDEEAGNSQQWLVELTEGRIDTGFEMLHGRTLHGRQHRVATNVTGKGSTAILDHGMNPGLVSHFTKAALEKIADMVLASDAMNESMTQLKVARHQNNYAKMAQLLGLAVIHISEQDNQVPKAGYERKEGEFLSTWSCDGFFEEGLDPVQVGWGTHEQVIPGGGVFPSEGETNQLFIPVPGVSLMMKSFVPTFGEIKGYNIPHSEGSTLSSFLTVRDQDEVVYRPTCHYVYHPPQCAIDSWNEVLEKGRIGQRECGPTRVLKGLELESGRDAVGVLLIFHNDPLEYLTNGNDTKPWSYWAGTIVSVEQNLAKSGPLSAPTTVQVAASVLACVQWTQQNPQNGVIWPESVSHSFVLDKAAPYLGDVIFTPVQWGNEPENLQFIDFCVSSHNLIR